MPAGRDEAGAIIKTYKVGAAAVSPHRFVKNSTQPATGQDGTVIHATGSGDILGVSYIPLGYDDPIKYTAPMPAALAAITATTDQMIDVVLAGSSCVWVVQLGAALSAGTIVTSDANGKAVAAGTPTLGTPLFCFRLIEGGATDSYRPILMSGFVRG